MEPGLCQRGEELRLGPERSVVGTAGLAGLPACTLADRDRDEKATTRSQGRGHLRQDGLQLARLHVLEHVEGDHGVVRAAEVVVDRVELVDLSAAVALEVDEPLGDVGAADRQPGVLELVGIPPGS